MPPKKHTSIYLIRIIVASLFILGGSGALTLANRGFIERPRFDLPGWEPRPNAPGTMICRTDGVFDWVVETGSAGRPGNGAAINVGGFLFLNKLSAKFGKGGPNGPEASFVYGPEGVSATEGRTRRDLVFPDMERGGLRVFRRLFVADNGSARWLDVFVNERPNEIIFQATLESETLPGEGASFCATQGESGAGEWTVTAPSGSVPWLAHVGLGAGHRLESYASDVNRPMSDSPGRSTRRLYRDYEIRLEPGAEACLLSFVVPATTEQEASAHGCRIAANPADRLAWLSPSEIQSIRNFSPDEMPASEAPGIRLNTPLESICAGVSPVQVEAWDDQDVVRMELSYWEDWDLPQGHETYKHFLYANSTTGPRILYNICWDIENSPRHQGGFWALDGTAWDADGRSSSFYSKFFTLWHHNLCSGTCQSSVVVVEVRPSISFLHPSDGQIVWGTVPVKVKALAPDGVALVKLLIDDSLVADWAPAAPTEYEGTYDWSTLGLELRSLHSLRAEVLDQVGRSASSTIQTEVTAVQVTLEGRRLLSKFVILDLSASNPDALPLSDFVLLRKMGSGDFQALRTIPASSLANGLFRTVDFPLWRRETYTYRVEALDAEGRVIGRSNELTF